MSLVLKLILLWWKNLKIAIELVDLFSVSLNFLSIKLMFKELYYFNGKFSGLNVSLKYYHNTFLFPENVLRKFDFILPSEGIFYIIILW